MAKKFAERTQVFDIVKFRGQEDIPVPVKNLFKGEWKGHDAYFATFKYNKKLYKQKNLTSLFGIKEIEDAKKKIAEIKKQLLDGIDPFEVEKKKAAQENIIQMDAIYNLADRVEIAVRDDVKKKRGAANAYSSYNLHFKPLIKNMDIRDFNYSVAEQLFKQVEDKHLAEGKRSDNVIDNIRKTVRPALDKALARGVIPANPFDFKEFKRVFPKAKSKKLKLHHRIALKNKTKAFVDLTRELYVKFTTYKQEAADGFDNKIKYEDKSYQAALLTSLMCGRRVEEFIKILRYEHITDEHLVLTTTKTDTTEEYILPKEVMDRIEPLYILDENGKITLDEKGNKIRRRGLVFSIKKRTYQGKLKALLENLETEFRPDEKFTGHDNRKLLVSLIFDQGWADRKTGNQLISHAIDDVDNAYFNLLNKQERIMNKYWELQRGNLEPIYDEED